MCIVIITGVVIVVIHCFAAFLPFLQEAMKVSQDPILCTLDVFFKVLMRS